MKTEVLDSYDQLLSVADEWQVLCEQSSANSLFLTWDWVQAWLESRQTTVRFFVITVRSDKGQLIGLAPFYIQPYRLLGMLPYRVLRILGDTQSGAEYPGWLASREQETAVYEALSRSLLEHKKYWQLAWIPNLAGWTDATRRLKNTLEKLKFLDVHLRSLCFSSIPLPSSMQHFQNQMSGSWRKSMKRTQNRFVDRKVEFRRLSEASQLDEFLECLLDLHTRRWNAAGKPGSFAKHPLLWRFYLAFIPLAAKRGWLRIYQLTLDGQPAAIQLGYVYNKIFHQMQEGQNPESPAGSGNLLRHYVISQCIEEGCTEYDFLGGYSEHKRRWGANSRNGTSLLLCRKTLYTLPFRLKKIWPTGRYLKPCD